MDTEIVRTLQDCHDLSDEDVVARVRAGDHRFFEVIMRRHNQRIYRAVRSITGSDEEAEDVMQDAYVRAYEHLDQFEGRARFATWLTRIAVYEALARRRRDTRHVDIEDVLPTLAARGHGPEQKATDRELAAVLEEAIDDLTAALSPGVRAARGGRAEHGGDGPVSRHSGGDGEDAAASRARPASPSTVGARRRPRGRRLPVRRATLRSRGGGRARAAHSALSGGGNPTTRLSAAGAPDGAPRAPCRCGRPRRRRARRRPPRAR